mgnify:CR=1 FL=1
MKTAVRKKINKEIGKYLKPIYFDEIPLGGLFTILENHGYRACQEDGRPWSGFLVGREGHLGFAIRGIGSTLLHKNHLELMWYRMPSGRYEITAYVS